MKRFLLHTFPETSYRLHRILAKWYWNLRIVPLIDTMNRVREEYTAQARLDQDGKGTLFWPRDVMAGLNTRIHSDLEYRKACDAHTYRLRFYYRIHRAFACYCDECEAER